MPSDFLYDIQHSETTGRQNNAFYTFNYLESRFTVADEGRDQRASLRDARRPARAGVRLAGRVLGGNYEFGFDGSTPLFFTSKYRDYKSPTPLAIGAEARLIEAEAALSAGDVANFLAKLNQARAATRRRIRPIPDRRRFRVPPARSRLADIPASTAGRVRTCSSASGR